MGSRPCVGILRKAGLKPHEYPGSSTPSIPSIPFDVRYRYVRRDAGGVIESGLVGR